MRKKITMMAIIGLLFLLSIDSAYAYVNVKPNTNNPIEYWCITISPSSGGAPGMSLVFRDILCENGWERSHIRALSGDDGTYQKLVNALIWLADNSDENDIVMFHHMGHGWKNFFCLQSEWMLYSELDSYLDDVSCNGAMIMLNGCYSGGAIQYLEQEGRVILTATDADHVACGSYFSKFCCIGLNGFADFEGNNNKIVTAEELYTFVKNDTKNTNMGISPQISDNYDGELYLTHFNFLNWPGFFDQYAVHKGDSQSPIWDDQWLSQSFVPTYPVLTALMLNIDVKGNPGPLIISIKEDLYQNDIYSTTIDQSYFYSGSSKFWIFNLPDIAVIPGHKYWIIMKSYNSIMGYFFLTGGNSYSNGDKAYSTNQGATWNVYNSSQNSRDIYFVTIGRPVDNPPDLPNINGPANGKIGVLHNYTISSNDIDGHNIYYYIDWGDNKYSGWLGPYVSGETITVSHTWNKRGTYTIKVKAKDIYCADSNWASLAVTMPMNLQQRSQPVNKN